MGAIVIHIPGKSERQARFAAANVASAAAQVGHTLGMGYAREGWYHAALGTDPIVFDYYTDRLRTDGSQYDNNLLLRTADMGTVIEIIDARIDVTQQNDIRSTPVTGRAGTVKELIQKQDYTISVKGNLIGERNKFPYDALHKLEIILNEEKSFEAKSVLLEAFGIDWVVLKTATFKQEELKYFNTLPFVMTFESDYNYNFLLEDE